MFEYDYSFCSAECKHADCYRNMLNIRKGERVIMTVSDFSKTDVCPYYQQTEGKEDEEV